MYNIIPTTMNCYNGLTAAQILVKIGFFLLTDINFSLEGAMNLIFVPISSFQHVLYTCI